MHFKIERSIRLEYQSGNPTPSRAIDRTSGEIKNHSTIAEQEPKKEGGSTYLYSILTGSSLMCTNPKVWRFSTHPVYAHLVCVHAMSTVQDVAPLIPQEPFGSETL